MVGRHLNWPWMEGEAWNYPRIKAFLFLQSVPGLEDREVAFRIKLLWTTRGSICTHLLISTSCWVTTTTVEPCFLNKRQGRKWEFSFLYQWKSQRKNPESLVPFEWSIIQRNIAHIEKVICSKSLDLFWVYSRWQWEPISETPNIIKKQDQMQLNILPWEQRLKRWIKKETQTILEQNRYISIGLSDTEDSVVWMDIVWITKNTNIFYWNKQKCLHSSMSHLETNSCLTVFLSKNNAEAQTPPFF